MLRQRMRANEFKIVKESEMENVDKYEKVAAGLDVKQKEQVAKSRDLEEAVLHLLYDAECNNSDTSLKCEF